MLTLSEADFSELKTIFEKEYSIRAQDLKKLQGFYDANIKVTAEEGTFFVKIYGFDELPAIQFQASLIETLYKAKIPVGKLFRTNSDAPYFAFKDTYGIVQEFIEGELLDNSTIDETVISSIGEMLGRFDRVTYDAEFAGEKWKKYAWDLAQFEIVVGNL